MSSGWVGQLWTFFLKAFFNHSCCYPLVHSGLAGVALVPTVMGFPLVLPKLPWLFALVDEGLLTLLGLVRNSPPRFGVQVVVFVLVDLGQSLCCMLVNFIVIVVQNGLPSFFVRIVDLCCPFPGCQGRISLSLSKMWFVPRCLWSLVVFVDVERRDQSVVLCWTPLCKVVETFPLAWIGPCLPN